jgi:RNA polymerase sigma-70 factor (ECF subfamily)
VSAIDPLLAAPRPSTAVPAAATGHDRRADARRRTAPVTTEHADDDLPRAGSALPTAESEVMEVASDGFAAFYSSARTSVGRALAVTLGDSDLASDAVDEAMVRAYQRWDRVSTLDNPAGWVYRVGLNHARSRLRRLLRRPPPPHTIAAEFTVADPAIERAIARLSVDHRAVVVCRHLLGWSEAQTAAALELRPGTVKSRLTRALTRLEAELHHLRPEDPS